MGYELIVTEKPSQAKKIAECLADTKPTIKKENGVSYHIITHNKKDIVVCSGVGHVYSLNEKEKSFKYPSFDIHWIPAYEANKNSTHTKKYINVVKKLAKGASEFTVATDFDVEGEVIGLNLIRFACGQKDAHRMKFSTLTKPDVIAAYENKLKHLNWGQANAGETRHYLDWMYGINLSRALTTAIRKAGLYKTMSSGRVQGPALKILVDKEKEIRKFIPTPYWQISYDGKVSGKTICANHKEDKFTDKKKADSAFAKANKHDAVVDSVEKRQSKSQPPTPFDLTTLQTEAFRSLKISPKDSLAVAQELYSKGYTSYPRTSSQELPKELGLKKLVEALLRHPLYKDLAKRILDETKLVPNNGKKKDPAHPAIYPTGIIPDESKMSPRELKIYDLIVRRFLATFAGPATRETNKIILDVNSEIFIAKGTRTIVKGWHEFYGRHVKLEEEELPVVEKGTSVAYKKCELLSKMTTPPKRYTPASLIKELEKRNLGTKATRAAIIDTLVQRDYVSEKTLEASEIGIKTSDIMQEFVPDIVQEDLTREFEEEMEEIREHKQTKDKVLEAAKKTLIKILKEFKEKEANIGKKLKSSLIETQEEENTLGPCPVCKKGTLMIKYSPRFKSHFVGCDAYPDCTATFSLPRGVKVQNTDKVCEHCNFPMVKIGTGRSERIACFNPKCPQKLKEEKEQEHDPKTKAALEKPCPLCGSKLLLRRSMYGEFIGCSNFPKCKYTAQADGTPNAPKKDSSTKTTTKKSTKKTTKKSTKKATKKTSKKVTKKQLNKK